MTDVGSVEVRRSLAEIREALWIKRRRRRYQKSAKGTDVRETVPAEEYKINVTFDDPYHQPHLSNFFNAIRGQEELNCPGEIGYETAVAVLKVNDAVRTRQMQLFTEDEFHI